MILKLKTLNINQILSIYSVHLHQYPSNQYLSSVSGPFQFSIFSHYKFGEAYVFGPPMAWQVEQKQPEPRGRSGRGSTGGVKPLRAKNFFRLKMRFLHFSANFKHFIKNFDKNIFFTPRGSKFSKFFKNFQKFFFCLKLHETCRNHIFRRKK